MAISNTTYYEALILGNPISPNPEVGPDGLVRAPMSPGFGGQPRELLVRQL